MARLDHARREIASSLEELREIARGIHPAVVSGHGLDVALEQLAARASVPVRLTVEVGRTAAGGARGGCRTTSSPRALANVGKYAQASSATVAVSRTDGQVMVEVVDDGVGGADTERGTGLRGLADRVEALEGRLRIWSPQRRGHASPSGDPMRAVIAEDSVLLREGRRAHPSRRGPLRRRRAARRPTTSC